jgi:hypothetical protein
MANDLSLAVYRFKINRDATLFHFIISDCLLTGDWQTETKCNSIAIDIVLCPYFTIMRFYDTAVGKEKMAT